MGVRAARDGYGSVIETRDSRYSQTPYRQAARVFALVLFFTALPCGDLDAADSRFDEAREAARDGRYEVVVDRLSEALGDPGLTTEETVIALANRGIALSLMKSFEPARADLERAIALDPDHVLTLNHLGIIAQHVDGEPAAAAAWYERAANAGFAASQVNLANLYNKGLGVERDRARAVELYRSAAAQNYTSAYLPLAEMLDEQDPAAARPWWERAAEAGSVRAMLRVGRLAERAGDASRARDVYERAAAQGSGEAQNALGYLFRRGAPGVERDYVAAQRWYEAAIDAGVTEAMNRLAWLLAGCPVPAVCDGRRAVELAGRAVALEPRPGWRDTLAAAHARAGEYDRALDIMKQLIAEAGSRPAWVSRRDAYADGIPMQLK